MDKKYQDLHIYNWKNHGTSVMRKIEIKQIVFSENEIIINFINSKTSMTLIIPKMYNSITID